MMHSFREQLANLHTSRRRNHRSDNHSLASLPGQIVFLESEAARVALDLGREKFRTIPAASGM